MVFVVEDKEEGQERGDSTLVLVYPLALSHIAEAEQVSASAIGK